MIEICRVLADGTGTSPPIGSRRRQSLRYSSSETQGTQSVRPGEI